ncbi:hydroxyacid dehydrogenase [Lachnoclostridium sp. An14]|uniref:four-carbon acid sugar kinase family protein n=1 Tax=Lachnoclostridium sp. An14 TaxID=1965562 RepID=UPI000B3AA4A9|nr:four-carbon acid sugar kinase family protein [Lachnoclostridium sp. An14]OUQ21583.1 hydroxyacid dehydrogenase [Lachnoclostridium sp. An14]
MRAEILEQFPRVDGAAVQAALETEIQKDHHKIIVLDDDPTGVQTVHGISVYTDWTRESVRAGFEEENRAFYILTNSRGFTVDQTTRAHLEIGRTVAEVARELGRDYVIVSRGDSTLRGHYPLETDLLRQTMEEGGRPVDGEILCPYFKEGGRFTIGGVHYVRYGEELIPAGETEFAKDKTFGYRSSNLREYIEEKTGGVYRKEDVTEISLEELRGLDYEGITEKLLAVKDYGKVVVNAVDACDLKIFCTCLYRAMAQGRRYLFRTAAGFVKEFAGISDKALLTRSEMVKTETSHGGIVVVGSHTQKTTSQLEELKRLEGVEFLEFNSDLVLDDEAFAKEVEATVAKEEAFIAGGKTVVVYTKRRLLSLEGDTPEQALLRSVKISDAVQSLVGKLKVVPAFVVAKGGITSSDVGTKALRVKKATVLGQIRLGIPVWKTGSESTFPGIPYVIFPGNVGEVETLREAVEVLLGKEEA